MGLFSAVKSFVTQKFWAPAAGRAADYNAFNTSVYAVGFAAAAAYIGFPLLKRLGIELDRRFFLSVTPYILLGGAARVLEDRALVDSVLLVTPFIYLVMFAATIGTLVAARYLFGDEYYRPFGLVGAAGFLVTVAIYQFSNWQAVPLTAAVLIATAGTGYLLLERYRPELAGYSFVVPVAAHYYDASTSVVALFFGGSEKHVLAQFFVDLFGLPGMFVMKTVVIVPAVYFIQRDFEGDRKKYYLFIVALLGLALGTRNLLSVATA
ncbi:MAG: DUF63 family protein [Candidatus Nanohaloarchaea archaeon]